MKVTDDMLTESKDHPGWWEWEGIDTKEEINVELPGKNIIITKLRTLGGYIYKRGGNIDMVGGDIYTSGGSIYTNGGGIYTSSGNIETSGGSIYTSGGDIETFGGSIYTNGGYIYTAEGNIETSGGSIYTSGGNIYTSGGNICTNGGNIEMHDGDIDLHDGDIDLHDGDIDTCGGGIKAKKITADCLYYNLIYPPLCDDLNIESIRLPSQAKPYFESVLGFELPGCWDEIEEQLKPMIPELLKREDLKHFRWILEIMQGNDK